MPSGNTGSGEIHVRTLRNLVKEPKFRSVGKINPVSDNVLDPAVVIDMSEVDLAGFLAGLEELHPSLAAERL